MRHFEKVYCISLDRRIDRWKEFTEQFPTHPIERFKAIDGKLVKHPEWWKAGGGAWGCYRSHLAILENILNGTENSVFIFEDDAVPIENFDEHYETFMSHLPDDWGMVYLGGQHLFQGQHPPNKINEHVYRPYNVNRTHAYGIRGRDLIEKVYKHLTTKDWRDRQHIDHHLGRLHQRRDMPIYCPAQWLVGQNEGRSNISGKTNGLNFWNSAKSIASPSLPFIPVYGLHSSGSSCLALLLKALGVHMGNQLTGRWGGEAIGLAEFCEWACPFPSLNIIEDHGIALSKLRKWINARREEAAVMNTIAGGKYPQMVMFHQLITEIVGDHLKPIYIERDIEDSMLSLINRLRKDNQRFDERQVREHQLMLAQAKESARQVNPGLSIDYIQLLEEPLSIIDEIKDYLKITPNSGQIQEAFNTVRPDMVSIHPGVLR